MESLMTTENAALIVGAIAATIAAIAYAIRLVSLAISSYITARANIKLGQAKVTEDLRRSEAEILRLNAEAQVKDREADNDQMARIIGIMETQNQQVARFASIAEDFATAQNRDHEMQEKNRQTNEKVAASMAELATQTKAVNTSIQAWPKLVDGTLDSLAQKVEALETTVKNDHQHLSELVKTEVVTRLEEVVKLLKATATPAPIGNVSAETS